MMWNTATWWHWLPMTIVWLIVVGTIVWAAMSVFPAERHRGSTARTVLDERLARGQLDLEEYPRLRDELERP